MRLAYYNIAFSGRFPHYPFAQSSPRSGRIEGYPRQSQSLLRYGLRPTQRERFYSLQQKVLAV
jgi:hypothetical protein